MAGIKIITQLVSAETPAEFFLVIAYFPTFDSSPIGMLKPLFRLSPSSVC